MDSTPPQLPPEPEPLLTFMSDPSDLVDVYGSSRMGLVVGKCGDEVESNEHKEVAGLSFEEM